VPKEKKTPIKDGSQKNEKKPPKKKGLPDGLPDIKPQIYTGSGRGFTYSYYLNILLNKIGQNWNNPYRDKDVILKSIVYFEVDKDGLISNIRIEDDSGDEVYNESTMRAVALAKKLPPLPQEFSDDYLKVHLEFLTGR
jgi:TonB family protein